MEFLLVLVVVAAVVLIVAGPLRPGAAVAVRSSEASRRDELEALKEARYREIRDAEMDFRTGKLSDEDWRAIDRSLRAEAIALLKELDEVSNPGDPPQLGST